MGLGRIQNLHYPGTLVPNKTEGLDVKHRKGAMDTFLPQVAFFGNFVEFASKWCILSAFRGNGILNETTFSVVKMLFVSLHTTFLPLKKASHSIYIFIFIDY